MDKAILMTLTFGVPAAAVLYMALDLYANHKKLQELKQEHQDMIDGWNRKIDEIKARKEQDMTFVELVAWLEKYR